MKYSDLTPEQRADVDAQVRRKEELRQKRALERAASMGRLAAVEDRWNHRMTVLAARNRAAECA